MDGERTDPADEVPSPAPQATDEGARARSREAWDGRPGPAAQGQAERRGWRRRTARATKRRRSTP